MRDAIWVTSFKESSSWSWRTDIQTCVRGVWWWWLVLWWIPARRTPFSSCTFWRCRRKEDRQICLRLERKFWTKMQGGKNLINKNIHSLLRFFYSSSFFFQKHTRWNDFFHTLWNNNWLTVGKQRHNGVRGSGEMRWCCFHRHDTIQRYTAIQCSTKTCANHHDIQLK